jgi:hypothetical protein
MIVFIPDELFPDKPSWLTEEMERNGWRPLNIGSIALPICQSSENGTVYQLVISKESKKERSDSWEPASWDLTICCSDGSVIEECELRIVAELKQIYTITGFESTRKSRTKHPGIPVSAFTLSFISGDYSKDIKLLYDVVSGSEDDPYHWISGEINFDQC